MNLILKPTGKLNLKATMQGMETGDVLSLTDEQVDLNYCRCQASNLGRTLNRTYEVSSPRELNGKIIITRQA